VNVLDENILESQRQLLRASRISVRQIGHDLGRKGMDDEQVIPLLLRLHRPTFFTRDLGFYDHTNCHARYCVVSPAVGQYVAAHFIRRVLRHPEVATQAKRMGTVIRVMDTGLVMWRLGVDHELRISWTQKY
jgi:hypothetical protein